MIMIILIFLNLKTKTIMTKEFYKKAYDTYKKLSIFKRHLIRSMFEFLSDNPEQQFSVTELMVRFRIEHSETSNMLSILKINDFVTSQRSGKNVLYSVNIDTVTKINNATKKIR